MIRFAAVGLLVSALSGCAWFGIGRELPDSPVIDDAHRSRIIQATAASEADIQASRKLLREERTVDSLNLLVNRIKFLQTLLYDEYILKSRAYDAMDLQTARGYGGLIVDLRRAEEGLVKSLNEPLNKILNDILIRNPDPRRREEAVDRIKSLQTLLYDEYIVKSRSYDAMDLPTAREYAQLILDLKRAEEGLVKSLNGPLNSILNDLLVRNPDPRRREEAVDAINGGANEIFIQFKTGYREEIVRSFRVRLRTERNVAVKVKMAAVLSKLATGQGERAAAAAALEN